MLKPAIDLLERSATQRHRLGRVERPARFVPPLPLQKAPEGVAAQEKKRVVSVDALRGFDMAWILGGDAIALALRDMSVGHGVVVATAGALLGDQFRHADWEGLTFFDLLFPMFIFVTGVSIVFSLSGIVEREGRAAAHWRVFRRFALLFLLGLIFYGGLAKLWPDIRLLGVLQRIALCYLFASLLFLNFGLRGLIVAFVSLLVGYWALMTFVPVPGIGAASYTEGANLANWLDQNYLPGLKWDGEWDPEGLLSTLPAIALCLSGVFAGLLLQNARVPSQQKALWLIGAGILLIAAGWVWGLQFPIIKKLWTSSFVLVAGGCSLLFLGVFHQICDVWGYKRWTAVFIWVGANAILLYMLNNMVAFSEVATRLVGGDVAAFLDGHVTAGTGQLAAAAGGLALAIVLARYLHRRKIFLRV